jgi:hypothetical protein
MTHRIREQARSHIDLRRTKGPRLLKRISPIGNTLLVTMR